jgi:hypothetical protein
VKARRALTLALVVLATLAGAYAALVTFRQDKVLSVGSIRLSVSPGHRGALDVYVPLVDWGARFEAIRLPARLRVDVRTVDRRVVGRLAQGAGVDLADARRDARNAIASYLRALLAVVGLAAAGFGGLVALAVRSRAGPSPRTTLATAGVTALAVVVGLVVLLPPRGAIDQPEYYAFGPDIPRALRAVEAATRSRQILDEELNAQLVGLARLVVDPARRPEIEGFPRATIASDLHNNVLAVPILDRAARNGPVLFVGDATDRGSPLETTLVRQIVRTGRPFVFVSGNHDSDALARRFARDGAIVLTQFGRLRPNGTVGDTVVDVAGLRIAGYSDPFERRSAEDFQDRYDRTPSPQQQVAFDEWFETIRGGVDVVMVHEPSLLTMTLARLRESPPPDPIVFAVGHTHRPDLERLPNVTVINGGSIGGGGTGNLAEENSTPLGLAVLVYDREGRFRPLAGDLVGIEPGTGSSTARRERLDVPVEGDGA